MKIETRFKKKLREHIERERATWNIIRDLYGKLLKKS